MKVSDIELELERSLTLVELNESESDDDRRWFSEHKSRREKILGTSSSTTTRNRMQRSKSTVDLRALPRSSRRRWSLGDERRGSFTATAKTGSRSDSCLVEFPTCRRGHSTLDSPGPNATFDTANFDESSLSLQSSSSTVDSQKSKFRNYFSQLTTEKKTTGRHSAIEKGLLRQLEIATEENKRVVEEFSRKVQERDEAIEYLERVVILKDDRVNALQAELERLQKKYEKEKRRRKSLEY